MNYGGVCRTAPATPGLLNMNLNNFRFLRGSKEKLSYLSMVETPVLCGQNRGGVDGDAGQETAALGSHPGQELADSETAGTPVTISVFPYLTIYCISVTT